MACGASTGWSGSIFATASSYLFDYDDSVHDLFFHMERMERIIFEMFYSFTIPTSSYRTRNLKSQVKALRNIKAGEEITLDFGTAAKATDATVTEVVDRAYRPHSLDNRHGNNI